MEKNRVLSDRSIRKLIKNRSVRSNSWMSIEADQIQPASLDLRVTSLCTRVLASSKANNDTVSNVVNSMCMWPMDIESDSGVILEVGCTYVLKVLEVLDLPCDVSARINPKSSIGRLDLFVRALTDYNDSFDHVGYRYNGPIYLEVTPRSFPIVIRAGDRLAQIRFIGLASHIETVGSVPVHVKLKGEADEVVAYKAKKNTMPVSLKSNRVYRISDYWEPIYSTEGPLILNPGDFYILGSNEDYIEIPPDKCAEMVPFDPSIGEFRAHYAGFFDPGFGWTNPGTRAVMEVRAHDIPFALYDGDLIGNIKFSNMRERPEKLYGEGIGSSYQGQGLALSKHFRLD